MTNPRQAAPGYLSPMMGHLSLIISSSGARGCALPQSTNGEERSSPFGTTDWPIEHLADVGALSLERLEVQAPRKQVRLEVGRHLGRLLGNDLLGQVNVSVVFHPGAGGDQPAHDDVLL